jgi:hypothetical protein
MAAWVPCAGATLHMPSGPSSGSGKHLFIVLNDPKPFANYGPALCIVLVSLSSVLAQEVRFDDTCILRAGCHPSVRHDTYVYYRGTRMEQLRDVLKRLDDSFYTPGEPIAATVLTSVKAGLLKSPFTKREFKQLGI